MKIRVFFTSLAFIGFLAMMGTGVQAVTNFYPETIDHCWVPQHHPEAYMPEFTPGVAGDGRHLYCR